MSQMAVMQRKPDTRSSDSIHKSTRCRCLEREGWMEYITCPKSNFPQSSQNTVPGTRDASSGRNARCSRNRSEPSGRGSNWPEISEILRCSTLPSTVNCAAAILSGSEFRSSRARHSDQFNSKSRKTHGIPSGIGFAVQLLLGHTKVDSTVRYLGVELEDALSIA